MAIGRPTDPRVRLTIHIREDTKQRILDAIDASRKDLNTRGKVIEKKFPPRRKS